jgi:hypothetical protein
MYKRGEGKTYKVLSRSGPSLLANSVMDRLLREESEMSRGRVREQAIITSANYNMKIIGRELVDGAACDVIELIPKRRSPYLVKGRMWVDPAAMIVKIEGKLSASVSFFEGRPQVVREYKDIDGFVFAQRVHAASSSFPIREQYRRYRISRLPRDHPKSVNREGGDMNFSLGFFRSLIRRSIGTRRCSCASSSVRYCAA